MYSFSLSQWLRRWDCRCPQLPRPPLRWWGPVSGAAGAAAADPDWKDKFKERAEKVREKQQNRVDQAEREDAAAGAMRDGALNPLMVDTAAALIDGAPHYFSHPNYANSPLPEVTTEPGPQTTVGNPLQDRAYATDNASDVFVVVPQPLPDGMIQSFETWNQASAGGSFAPSAGLNFHAYVLRPTGNASEYTVVFDSGQLTVPALSDPAVREVATYSVANLAVQAGDVLAFYGQGVPLDIGAGADLVAYPTLTPPLQDSTLTLGSAEFPNFNQQREYSFAAGVVEADRVTIAGGMKKFVDELPAVGTDIPVAQADTTTYPGSSYYEIALVEYEQQMHADLPPTKLRGYVQLKTPAQAGDGDPLTAPDGSPIQLPDGSQAIGVTAPSYLGPAIVTDKDVPVRILFRNLLPTGQAGNLFIPTDTTVHGSGLTADGRAVDPAADPQNPLYGGAGKAEQVALNNCYAENRAVPHLHGGVTPWISDGTPHQWITPAGESTDYPEGVSVESVPDMPDPGPGAQTLFYTNAQSARLMFYHDHAWGITRLNVYAGEAAPYIITDDTERALLVAGVLPPAENTIPLVVQDKTFVPSQEQLDWQDETWDSNRWGDEGDLWVPHVYSPAQNPGDPPGVNAYGRWAYGPWFWPPTNSIMHGPIDNPYFDPNCDPDVQWCEPPKMPGTPYNSMGMESFNDTPVVNGVAYPTVTLEQELPARILNAANDRFFNLSLYRAVDANGQVCDAANTNPAAESTGVACTEVALDPDVVAAALGHHGVPDATSHHQGAGLDPDRYRGRLPTFPGGHARAAHHVGQPPDGVQCGQRRQALAPDRASGAARRHRRPVGVRRPDADPLRRRSSSIPGA